MRLLSFDHGVHPAEYKSFSSSKPIEVQPLPNEVFVPLQQHIGRPCEPLVKKKDEVKTGQVIGQASGFVSSPVHSSVTGVVKNIGFFMHSMGHRIPMIHIERKGEDDWEYLEKPDDWKSASVEELDKVILSAGIVGMGGAAFPTHVKLKVLPEKPIDTFILNGCECEPYLTCDHRMMLEKSDRILEGMAIAMKVLNVKDGFIGIENNKKDAIEAMRQRVEAGGYPFKVVPLKVKYPQGAEKMLIKAIVNRKVPTGGLPGDVGVIVSNVGTVHAIMEAVVEGKPLVSRVVAVTGDAIQTPKNVEARVGTPLKSVLENCGGLKENVTQVIMGGPMMGFSQFDVSIPIVKATSGIVCSGLTSEVAEKVYPCIRCNSCVTACPMYLLPNRLSRLSEKAFYEESDQLGILNCIECGSCVYVCPSNIPILQWLRVGKYKVNELKRKQT